MKRKLGESDTDYQARADRDDQVVAFLEAGELSLREIGARFGISHEMVRLIGKDHPGVLERRQARQVELAAQAEKEERERGLLTVEEAWALIDTLPLCLICQGPVPVGLVKGRRRETTCSHRCAWFWYQLRYVLSERDREINRVSTAQSILRHPEKFSPAALKYARRIVDGDPPPPNRRWVGRKNQDLLDELGISVDAPPVRSKW